ncbi:insulinase family protein [Halomonas sp. PR-M31]|uniref:insulinase family protein n=1 Tax=Halomonas sp. PR-M31 TaxID=1471202 RepID=UPI000650ECD1|nr:insulinase family protein [Halomonas sp. PR-M31]
MAKRRLANGLRMQAIEAPTARQVRLVCAIGVGYLDEPENLPGLAHLLEHALFLGSSRHPEPGDFAAWVNDQGGRYNAHTDEYATDVHLTLPPDESQAGLERLLDIVLHPLLSETHIAREVEVIEAEYQARLNDPALHRQRALSRLFKASHPAFDCHHGNRQSLGSDISALRCALRDFHACHYRAEGLSLVMLGPQSLTRQLDLLTAAAAGIPAETGTAPTRTWPWAEPGWIQWSLLKHQPPANPLLELIWPLPDPLTPAQRQISERLVQVLKDGALATTLAQHDAIHDMALCLVADGGAPFLLLSLTLSASGHRQRDSLIATCQAWVEDVATRLTMGDASGQPGSLIHNLDTWPKTLARRLAVDARTLSMTGETSDANASLDDQAIKTLAPMLTAKCCRILEALPDLAQADTIPETGTRLRHRPPLVFDSAWRSTILPSRSAPSIPRRALLADDSLAASGLILDNEKLALWWDGEPVCKNAFWCLGWPASATHQAARLACWRQNTLALRQAALAHGIALTLEGDTRGDWLMATGDAERLESALVQTLHLWPSRQPAGISTPLPTSSEGLLAQRLLNLLDSQPTVRQKNDARTLVWAGGTLSDAEARAGCQRLLASCENVFANLASEVDICASTSSPAATTSRSTIVKDWPIHRLTPQGDDAAVMLQIDAPDASPISQALFQLLAQCHDAAFHHEMRQRQKLGYVAAVRYREAPDGWPRLGYVVQSPHAGSEALCETVNAFLKTQGVALACLDSTTFDRRRTALSTRWSRPETPGEALMRAWQGVRRRGDWKPWETEQAALTALSGERLTRLAQDLVEGRLAGQWWVHRPRTCSS